MVSGVCTERGQGCCFKHSCQVKCTEKVRFEQRLETGNRRRPVAFQRKTFSVRVQPVQNPGLGACLVCLKKSRKAIGWSKVKTGRSSRGGKRGKEELKARGMKIPFFRNEIIYEHGEVRWVLPSCRKEDFWAFWEWMALQQAAVYGRQIEEERHRKQVANVHTETVHICYFRMWWIFQQVSCHNQLLSKLFHSSALYSLVLS